MIVVMMVDYGDYVGVYQFVGKGVVVYQLQNYVLFVICYFVYLGGMQCDVLMLYIDIVLMLFGFIGFDDVWCVMICGSVLKGYDFMCWFVKLVDV